MAEKESSLRGTNVLTFTHRWTLTNFASLYDEACHWKWRVESEGFTVPGNTDVKFSLSIWPKVKGETGEEHLKVVLVAKQLPAPWEGKVTVKEIRAIEDGEGWELLTKEYPDKEVYANCWMNNDEFVPVRKLFDQSTRYLRKGTLKVLSQVTLLSQEVTFNCPPSKVHTFSTTTIPSSVSRLSHRLTLAHFKWLAGESTRQMPFRVESPYFAPERGDIGRLKLQFYPKEGKGSDEEKVKIVIRNDNQSSLLVHWECSLIDGKGDKCHQKESTDQIASFKGKFWSPSRRTLLSLLSSLPKDELIIDCQLTVLAQEKGVNTYTPSCTLIDLSLFIYHYLPFTWTIDRFLKRVSPQECAISPIFSPSTDSRFTAFLRVYPKKDSEYVKIELHLAAKGRIEQCKFQWRHAVVNAKGEECNSVVYSGVLKNGKGSGFLGKLISHKELDNYRSILIPGDQLTIKSQVWIHEPRKKLQPELSNLSTKGSASDLARGVTNIIIGDNARFPNAIIAAQSTLNTGNIAQSLVRKSAKSSDSKVRNLNKRPLVRHVQKNM